MKLAAWSAIAGLGALSLAAYWETKVNPSYPMAFLAITPLVGLLAVFAIEILQWRIGGTYLVLEKRVQSLEQADTELKTVATALVKSLYALEEGDKTWRGSTDEHYALVRQYLEPIKHLLSPDLQQTAAKDVARIHAED